VVTAGGLVFIAATSDEKLRAFDKRCGGKLGTKPGDHYLAFRLPAGGAVQGV
jgi:glucose dehydrogenase